MKARKMTGLSGKLMGITSHFQQVNTHVDEK